MHLGFKKKKKKTIFEIYLMFMTLAIVKTLYINPISLSVFSAHYDDVYTKIPSRLYNHFKGIF